MGVLTTKMGRVKLRSHHTLFIYTQKDFQDKKWRVLNIKIREGRYINLRGMISWLERTNQREDLSAWPLSVDRE